MADKIAALLHVQKLNYELLFAYDKLVEECIKVGDDKGADEWLYKALEVMRHNDRLEEEIHELRVGRR